MWTCAGLDVDRYGRTVARCTVAGQDVGREMVRQGWSLAFLRYSHDYAADEAAAKAARAGIWAGAFIAAWDWRARSTKTAILGAVAVPKDAQAVLLGPGAADAPDSACVIKGNMNRKGECIFHSPGQRYYGKVNMAAGKGKRWFCTAAEAEAAGCRAAKL